jgi:hypothetical protein
MRYGADYDARYRGYDRGWEHGWRQGPARPAETNWMGRNYRDPGYQPARREVGPGRGQPPRGGAYDRPYRRPGGGGYDPDLRGRGGYDRPYGRGYDREYGPRGAPQFGRGPIGGMWGPYGPYRMLEGERWWRPWPNRYFTDHGHSSGPY